MRSPQALEIYSTYQAGVFVSPLRVKKDEVSRGLHEKDLVLGVGSLAQDYVLALSL